jgi:peptidoglycan/xylan/chitin deacetylase (PgdA/CDA1 family)
VSNLFSRIQARTRVVLSRRLAARPAVLRNDVPLISFTFDDFPRSALEVGGAVLQQFNIRATFYTSLGLMDQDAPVGKIFSREQVELVAKGGHELGCHTFGHCHAWNTPSSLFESSILENRRALSQILPGHSFQSLSYPIGHPRPRTKRLCQKYFACCREGGQTFNHGKIDLNSLRAFFLEKATRDRRSVSETIQNTVDSRGWLIFATHDISSQPTRFGCTPDFFASVVQESIDSGATILPVAEACRRFVRQTDGSALQRSAG